ncbi:MAG: S8 family peptidase [Clostridiales bacterium]|nr:S8 family peptidase [Clostridiales bacterium]
MKKLQYQQTDFQGNCENAVWSEEYYSYLVDYLFSDHLLQGKHDVSCVEPLGYNEAIVYIRKENASESFLNSEPALGYDQIPRCYGLMDMGELRETGVLRLQQSPQFGLRGQGVLVAIIDTGVSLTDSLFLYEDGTTKVVAYWDQGDQDGRKPEGYPFGTEWTREEIDALIAGNISRNAADYIPGGVTKDASYGIDGDLTDGDYGDTEMGNYTLPDDENGHGTFLAAVAAGREDAESGFSGVAPDSELIVVKLKRPKQYLLDFYSIEDSVWACQEDDVLLAIRYVLDVATRLKRPVSICLGIGSNMGGHSGTGSLERYISAISLLPGVSVHIASGNEGISGHHYHGEVPAGQSYTEVEFHVEEEENGFVMELWGNVPVTFSIGLLSPGGENVERIQLKLNETRSIRFFPKNTVLRIRSYTGETASGEQVIRMNFRHPVAGVWRLFVYATGNGARSFDLWMPISNFLKEETFFLSASADETITSPGDALYGITYVPYDISTDSLYVRASRGYTRDGRVKPDLAAPGVAVAIPGQTFRNQASNGQTSSSQISSDQIFPVQTSRQIIRSGSSVAAAFGAGIGALMQEWALVKGNNPSLNGQNMRFYLTQGANQTQAYDYPNREWGYGTVNIYDAFLSLRR